MSSSRTQHGVACGEKKFKCMPVFALYSSESLFYLVKWLYGHLIMKIFFKVYFKIFI